MHRPLVSKNNDVQKAKVTLVSLGAAGEKGGVYLRIVRMYSYDTTYGRAGFVLNVEVDVKYLSLASFFVRH